MKTLVLVESPTKAKTISAFLGKTYKVESSFGHIRDLPKSKLGVAIGEDFTPTYVIPTDKRKRVTELKKLAALADAVLFATDEDREGEAISWHLAEVLGQDPEKIKRITFHEITKKAIEEAIAHPRTLDIQLVDAQQGRRIMDRLVGYELSPFLWKKIQRGLSAGRVQSVAVRLIVEREREIQKFKAEEFWSVDAVFVHDNNRFEAKLTAIDGVKLEKLSITHENEARAIVQSLSQTAFSISNFETKRGKRSAPAPFTTSTLQQEANRKLGMSAKMTMMLAQQLYELGRITYMRTDSLNLSADFQNAAAEFIGREFGAQFTNGPRHHKTKSKNAQEAHEAIRPTDVSLTGDRFASTTQDHRVAKLYDLIWRRALASQMTDAIINQSALDVAGDGADKKTYLFHATGQSIAFAGYLALYPESQKEAELPRLSVGTLALTETIIPNQHFTEPPSRYSDATLVKILEEYGIGRPSTYAPTISTIIARGYVERDEKRRLAPTTIAFTVTDMLAEHFPSIVDYQFTAEMENDLDKIATGEMKLQPVLHLFYDPFKKILNEKMESVERIKREDEPTNEICDKCGKPMVIKMGRFGKFLACSGYPDCKNAKPIQNKIGVPCPVCNEGEIIEKRSKRGKIFYSCNRYPVCTAAFWNRPTGEKCAVCGSLMVLAGRDKTKCSNPECTTNASSKRKIKNNSPE